MSTRQRRPRKTRIQWQAIITDFSRSHLSANDYCQEHGLAYGTFAKWRQRLARVSNQQEAAHLIELCSPEPVALSNPNNWQVELELGNGMTLRLATL